jgi:hypothetical protein
MITGYYNEAPYRRVDLLAMLGLGNGDGSHLGSVGGGGVSLPSWLRPENFEYLSDS